MTTPRYPRASLSTHMTRIVTVVTYAVFAAGTLTPFLLHADGAMRAILAALRALGVIGCIVLFLLTRHSRQIHAPTREIDERERAERAASYLRSFQILIASCFAMLLVAVAPAVAGADALRDSLLVDTLIFIAVGGFALPAAVLAWRDRDDASDIQIG